MDGAIQAVDGVMDNAKSAMDTAIDRIKKEVNLQKLKSDSMCRLKTAHNWQEEKENLIISSVASGKVLCSSSIKSKSADAPLVVSWLPCSTKIVISRGDLCQLYYVPMKEPSYNPIKLLRTYRGTYGSVRHGFNLDF